MPFPNIDPVIFSIGPFALRWYGMAYVAGLLLAWWVARRIVSKDNLWRDDRSSITLQDLDDFVMWAMIGIVLGGRMGFVLFYSPLSYLNDPLAALRIWDGGMSFHGGMLGVFVAMFLFARSKGFSFVSLVDVVCSVAPIGLMFGRLANFINGELWGRPSDVPWAVVFPTADELPRHPSQLYQAALEGLLLFIVLQILVWRFGALKRPLFTAGAFALGYGVFRIFAEFFRTPDANLGFLFGNWVTMGMILSLPMIMAGLVVIFARKYFVKS